jgi:predicted DNA-binding transcriptional regulator AlpA
MKRFYNVEELAEMFDVSPSTISKWVKLGAIPQPIRMSRRVIRWDIATIESHVDRLHEKLTQQQPVKE